jgi:hypothetical protein
MGWQTFLFCANTVPGKHWQRPPWQYEFPWQIVVGVHLWSGRGDKTVTLAHCPFKKTCLVGQQQIPDSDEQYEFPVQRVTLTTQGSPGAATTREFGLRSLLLTYSVNCHANVVLNYLSIWARAESVGAD